MFEKKYKIKEREKILIENILIKKLIKLEERQKSLTIEVHKIKHPKNTSLKLFNTKEEISKIRYLIDYLRNLK